MFVHLKNSPEFRKQPIRMLTDDLISASHFLASLTSEDIACLKSFTKAPNLVQWITRDIKSKRLDFIMICHKNMHAYLPCSDVEWKELETFVELAGTKSAEEGDYETVKVTHLHAACAGFAPFLFEVTVDSTFKAFRSCCSRVLTSFGRDKDLIQKWVKRQLYLALVVYLCIYVLMIRNPVRGAWKSLK